MDVHYKQEEHEHGSCENDFDATMLHTADFKNAYYEAHQLWKTMECMDGMAHDSEKEHYDFCFLSFCITMSCSDLLLRCQA